VTLPLRLAGLALAAALLAAPARAAEPEPAFLRHFFAPELIMQQQGVIGLSAEQRERITRDIHAVQGRVLELQWEMQDDVRRLEELSAVEEVDEKQLVATARRIFEREGEVKAAHLGLLVRMRNILTPEQRARLQELRPRAEGR